MITPERIAELRAECEPDPPQADVIFVSNVDFRAARRAVEHLRDRGRVTHAPDAAHSSRA